ncbi:rhomboid family intramembrane serine protease [Oerskovia flava]|uniref:rhomboid family intramembrane serine protease n=1 Tax=Oerskovia flava TaxID=2986422 RepID=UPI002AD4636C|nr:rhomboid family intramembrane serine protease [Oerskovia sp. JB1-3-2]
MDCVRETAKAAPRTTTVLGGRVRGGRPVVTLTIIGLCVVSWLLQIVTAGAWTQQWAFAPVVGAEEPYRFLTAAFLHSTVLAYGILPIHILFNMYALWITGPFLEQTLGRARFVVLYVLSAVGGSVGYLLLAGGPTDQGWYTAVVGASGAVFGLFGAVMVVLNRLGRNAMQIVVLIGINFAIGLFVPNIAWEAHLGGLVVGALVGAGFAYAPKERRLLVGGGVSVLVALGLVVATVVTYASVPAF